MPTQKPLIQTPPIYCQYAGGPCDQDFDRLTAADAVFLYPSEPTIISDAIEAAIAKLRDIQPSANFRSWREFNVAGRIIFCEICKAMRASSVVFADTTTLNFNLLFEIGYAIGLGLSVIPVRDTTYTQDQHEFQQVGILDTLGYLNFTSSEDLTPQLLSNLGKSPLSLPSAAINQEQPLYLVKSSISTEGQIRLTSALDKSGIDYRTFDPQETARLSLYDAVKNVLQSHGVVAHLSSPNRGVRATVDNARCAFIAGLAMASGRAVLLLQEEDAQPPIDYRDIIRAYTKGSQVPGLIIPFVRTLIKRLQGGRAARTVIPLKPLEQLDFGDVAAENEINHLPTYFVPTGEYTNVKRGHARLVVGRKGAGKTAIFYGVIEAFSRSKDCTVLDIKPEGYQFSEFKSVVLKQLEQGAKEHVLTAFWHYLLLAELVRKIIETDENLASRDQDIAELYQQLIVAYGYEPAIEEGEFSERLLNLIGNIVTRASSLGRELRIDTITQLIYEKDIAAIARALIAYLARVKDAVWILIDNLDKGWPVGGLEDEDILIVRCLLDATRKIQRQLVRHSVETHAVVFLRNDVVELLLPEISDQGKETTVYLDWNDIATFQELARRRMVANSGEDRSFEDLWSSFFDSHVGAEETFSYIMSRTLMRPRDLIRFLRGCVNIAVNRGHDRVSENDVLAAEKEYSEDQLYELAFELRQVYPAFGDFLYAFLGEKAHMRSAYLDEQLEKAGIARQDIEKVKDALVWFGFLGVLTHEGSEAYAYQYRYGLTRLYREAETPRAYVIHPAFRVALGSVE